MEHETCGVRGGEAAQMMLDHDVTTSSQVHLRFSLLLFPYL